MIADFVYSRMNSYLNGGSTPESATHFTRGELEAIYRGNHHSRDTSGAMRKTPPLEAVDITTAMAKCNTAIKELLNSLAINETPVNTETNTTVFTRSAAIKHTIASGIGIKFFFVNSKDNDPAAYTTDLQEIADLWNQGKRRFKAFIHGQFLALDIDRKPDKPDGLQNFYRLFPRETLPAELQELPGSFPCYVQTPTGGFHLYFRYEGPELKLRELAPCVEVKEWQLICPGSRRENGEYILHGELKDAPPLYGLIIDAIETAKRKKECEKEERQKQKPRTRAAADTQFTQSRITLDDLAQEAVTAYAGNHDRQVSFAGRACRCKFSGADTLAYVKANQNIFGNDSDTENTILSVFRDNRAA
ncbi:MAG: bifunctional DNA primase/polymerase [Treponema sp.]|nr:bifunctional DNA primase/polymerase [Treponema sp.]